VGARPAAARFAKSGWERTAGGDGIEIRVARTLLIAVRPQFVAAREDTLRRAGDHGQLFRIIETLYAIKWPEDVHAANSARF